MSWYEIKIFAKTLRELSVKCVRMYFFFSTMRNAPGCRTPRQVTMLFKLILAGLGFELFGCPFLKHSVPKNMYLALGLHAVTV